MQLRHLGESGLVVSVVGLGCNNLGRPGTAAESLAGSRALVGAALDAGITLFDVADVYGAPRGRSEELLGQALSGRRDNAVIATKFGVDMQGANGPDFGARGSRRYVRRAVEAHLCEQLACLVGQESATGRVATLSARTTPTSAAARSREV